MIIDLYVELTKDIKLAKDYGGPQDSEQIIVYLRDKASSFYTKVHLTRNHVHSLYLKRYNSIMGEEDTYTMF